MGACARVQVRVHHHERALVWAEISQERERSTHFGPGLVGTLRSPGRAQPRGGEAAGGQRRRQTGPWLTLKCRCGERRAAHPVRQTWAYRHSCSMLRSPAREVAGQKGEPGGRAAKASACRRRSPDDLRDAGSCAARGCSAIAGVTSGFGQRCRGPIPRALAWLLQLVHLPQRASRLLLSLSLSEQGFADPPFTGVSIPPNGTAPAADLSSLIAHWPRHSFHVDQGFASSVSCRWTITRIATLYQAYRVVKHTRAQPNAWPILGAILVQWDSGASWLFAPRSASTTRGQSERAARSLVALSRQQVDCVFLHPDCIG